MSRLQSTYGTAEVTLEALVDQRFTDGQTLATYQPDDLLFATFQVLRAVDTQRSRNIIDAIEYGLKMKGLEL